ncbi:hypothetical protein BC939DRAFT_84407, partial [Gamsiella multidivaricata]|uniref:uncharacterized protein n=1 Tax=Gamsiella multidivaricata TaxID=101098 RepID=UPI00221F8355
KKKYQFVLPVTSNSFIFLLCLALGSVSILAVPVFTPLAKRAFNPRQKWQSDEVNCIRIMNPAPGATYYPGFFVRMTYGTEQCNGAAVAGPWTIHLYNNPNIETGEVRYDYHEVIATEVSEDKRNYIWNIPQDQYQKARNVKNKNNYYIRIETESQMGGKLVGNAGPFAIDEE